MPRRKNIHPSMRADNVSGGPDGTELLDAIEQEIESMDFNDEGPEDGDAYDDFDGDDEQEEQPRRSKRDPRDEELEALRARLNVLERAVPPAEPRRAREEEPEADEFDAVDWDAEFFADPKAALKKYGEMQERKISKRMRSEYESDQSSKDFWRDFYKKNPDLSEDHDMVEVVMSKNMSKLANLPVSQAITELGSLTRERISRYSNRGGNRGRKAQAEGGSDTAPPRPNRDSRQPERPKTMSDLINLRRTKRYTRRSTAA